GRVADDRDGDQQLDGRDEGLDRAVDPGQRPEHQPTVERRAQRQRQRGDGAQRRLQRRGGTGCEYHLRVHRPPAVHGRTRTELYEFLTGPVAHAGPWNAPVPGAGEQSDRQPFMRGLTSTTSVAAGALMSIGLPCSVTSASLLPSALSKASGTASP